MTQVYVRLVPVARQDSFFRCGTRFKKQWQAVEVDDATLNRLKAEQMLEVSVEQPADLENDTPNTADPVGVSGTGTASDPPAAAPTGSVSAPAAADAAPPATPARGAAAPAKKPAAAKKESAKPAAKAATKGGQKGSA